MFSVVDCFRLTREGEVVEGGCGVLLRFYVMYVMGGVFMKEWVVVFEKEVVVCCVIE